MKIKTKLISAVFSGALAITLIGWLAAHAATSGEMPAATTNSMAAPASTNVNPNPGAEMTALFGDPDIAKGKGVDVKQSELDEAIAQIKARAAASGRTLTSDEVTQFEAGFLMELVDSKLLLQKATDADRSQGAKEADAAIADLIKQHGKEAVELQLKGSGKTLDQARTELADQLTANEALVRELGVTVSDAEINAFYTNHPADFDQPEQVHVRHILFMTIDPVTQQPLTDEQKQEKYKLAQDVLKKARAGDDFAKLAGQYSEDPGTKDNGGELPAVSSEQLNAALGPEFGAAAFSLTNNQISDIVTTSYGYHIIKFIDKTPEQTVPLAKVSDNIKTYLLRQKLAPLAQPYLEKLRKAADVQILDPNLKTAVEELLASQTNAPAATPEQ